jgi:hypothetical protein
VPAGVLPARAVAYLPTVTKPLTARDVQADSTLPDLTAQLTAWGYLGGWQRTFQGESRRLTLVVSRSLDFRGSAGASAFVSYLHRRIASFYPYAQSWPVTVAGRSGWVIAPPLCACHMANPLLAGVVWQRHQVWWLEINGPRASTRLLIRLLTAMR